MLRRWLTPLVVALTLSPPLQAQDAQDRATARRLAEQAQAALDAKDYETAVERFSRAVSLVPAPTLLLALGRAHRERGQLVEAEQRLLEAARFPLKPGDPAPWPDAAKQAAAEAAALASRVPSLSIVLTPAGAPVSVKLDGRVLSPAALGAPIAVNPGPHTIVVAGSSGSRTESRSVAEREHARLELDVAELVALTPPPAASSAPPAASPASPSSSSPPPPPRAERRSAPVAGYVALGASAVFVGLGVVAGLTAKRKTDTLKESCVDGRCPAELKADRDTAAKWADVSTVSFVVGAAAAGAGAFLLLRSRRADVAVGPRSVEVSGAFLRVPAALACWLQERRRARRSLVRRRAGRVGGSRARRSRRSRRSRRGRELRRGGLRRGVRRGRCHLRRRPCAERLREV